MNVVNSTSCKMRTAGLSFHFSDTAVANVNITGSSFDPVAPEPDGRLIFRRTTRQTLNFNVNNNPKI